MIHDQALLDLLSQFPAQQFQGEVFRATGPSVDPLAPSVNGGRWSPRPDGDAGFSVLYTSLERDGALAELCSFIALLSPIPKARNMKVSRLGVSASRVVKIMPGDMHRLGIDQTQYGERDYDRTQEIGAALAFLEFDGLLAPSARWRCDNLMLFASNHSISEQLETLGQEEVEWRAWSAANGII